MVVVIRGESINLPRTTSAPLTDSFKLGGTDFRRIFYYIHFSKRKEKKKELNENR